MQIVNKPWGKEEWIELNDKYCFKKIYLNQGKRTSFQYHEKKLETFYVLSGKIEVLLENWGEKSERKIMATGDSYTVKPLQKHRVIAIEDAIYLEASTPEVDDVIRIQDDKNRGNGRIDSEYETKN